MNHLSVVELEDNLLFDSDDIWPEPELSPDISPEASAIGCFFFEEEPEERNMDDGAGITLPAAAAPTSASSSVLSFGLGGIGCVDEATLGMLPGRGRFLL